MSGKPSVPAELAPFVRSVGSPVEPKDIELYGQYQDIRDRSHKVRTILAAWERQQSEDRELRTTYAKWLMGAVSLQVLIAATAFYLIGFGIMTVPNWVASVFFGSVFAEVTGLALFVVKYLFPESGSQLLSLTEDLKDANLS